MYFQTQKRINLAPDKSNDRPKKTLIKGGLLREIVDIYAAKPVQFVRLT